MGALLALPCVTFAAYKVAHPLFFVFELRLTTDGAMGPKEALLEASKNMVEDLVMLGRRFTHEWELLKQAEMAGGIGNGDFEMVSERATYSRAVSSAGEAVNRGRNLQGRERSQQDTRYQFGAGSPARSSHPGCGSPVKVGYRGDGQQRIRSQAGPSSPEGVGRQTGGQPTSYQGRTRGLEKLDTPTGMDQDGNSLQDHGMSVYQARGLQGDAYQGVKSSGVGLQASWASGQQARSPDRMNHHGGVKAGSPPEDSYQAGAPAPSGSVNQGFWGDEKLERQTDSQTEGYQGYGSQGLGHGGYQFGGQQASITQAGGDWTPEYQRTNSQSSNHLDIKPSAGYHARHYAGGQQATITRGGDWTPEGQGPITQGSSYQNHLQSPNRGYHQGRGNDQARKTQTVDPQTPGYQSWGQHYRQEEGADAKDTAMQDDDW